VPSPFGNLTCTTSSSDIGTLTGQASGSSLIDIIAVLNCGGLLPTANVEGIYSVTSPEGLGATSTLPPPSPTALEVAGVSRNESIAITASANSSILLSAKGGGFANTCTASTLEGKTDEPFSGSTVGGKISVLTFKKCTEDLRGEVVVDEAGSLTVEHIDGATNGTVRSTGAKVTTPSPFGTLTCTTGNTDIGTLTGVASGNATMDVNAALICGFFLPSAEWEGSYVVTSPEALGVNS
jgi:hypothetical protein